MMTQGSSLTTSLLGGLTLSLAVATSTLAAGVEINASSTGLAMQGYDTVAYFTNDAATFWFTSWANRALFAAHPEAHVPAYGGSCALGAAMGFKSDGNPQQWKIVDDVLYLNLSKGIQVRWVADSPGFIEQANVNWRKIEAAAPAELLQ